MLGTLRERYIIKYHVKVVTPLHIGRGRGTRVREPDLPVLRLPSGEPHIPGSSIKGALRAEAERLLTGLGIEVCIYRDRKPGAGISPDYKCEPPNICPSCSIFGSQRVSSRTIFRDLFLKGAQQQQGVRTCVALDREKRTVAKGPFDIEFVPPGAVFEGEIVIENPEPWMLGLLFTVMESLPALGGQVSRGMGKVKIEVNSIEVYTPNSLIEQRPERVYSGDELKKFIEECKQRFREWVKQVKQKAGEGKGQGGL